MHLNPLLPLLTQAFQIRLPPVPAPRVAHRIQGTPEAAAAFQTSSEFPGVVLCDTEATVRLPPSLFHSFTCSPRRPPIISSPLQLPRLLNPLFQVFKALLLPRMSTWEAIKVRTPTPSRQPQYLHLPHQRLPPSLFQLPQTQLLMPTTAFPQLLQPRRVRHPLPTLHSCNMPTRFKRANARFANDGRFDSTGSNQGTQTGGVFVVGPGAAPDFSCVDSCTATRVDVSCASA